MGGVVLVGLIVVGILAVSSMNTRGGADQGQASSGGSYSVYSLATAIQRFEGFFPGSRSYRNNNPGNILYAGQPGAVGQDEKGFAIFDSYQSGWDALISLIYRRISQHPDWTILDFFNSYAPPSENDTAHYADTVAQLVGADVTTQIGEFS